jgi:hypothetical protein
MARVLSLSVHQSVRLWLAGRARCHSITVAILTEQERKTTPPFDAQNFKRFPCVYPEPVLANEALVS